MISWRGLAVSGLLHALAIGMVIAGVPAQKREIIEDTPSIAVELTLDIESSPLVSQAASDGAEEPPTESEPDSAPPQPEPIAWEPSELQAVNSFPLESADIASRDRAPQPVDRAAVATFDPRAHALAEAMPTEATQRELADRDWRPELVEQAFIKTSLLPARTMVAELRSDSGSVETIDRDQPPEPVKQNAIVASLPPSPDMIEELMSAPAAADRALRDRPPAPVPEVEVRLPAPVAQAAAPAPAKPAAKAPKLERQLKQEKTKSQAKTAKTQENKKPGQQAALASGKGSTGKTRTTDGSASDSSFKSKVLARLRGAKRYPDAARQKGIEGVAVLSFTIDASGRLTAARIIRGSGSALLDKATLAMARSAAPFPKIPPKLGRGQMTFRVPVQFKVD